MELDSLIDDYLGCRANKKRSLDTMHFELHRERDLVRLEDDFVNRNLVSLLYSYLTPRPRWREVNACLMQVKTIQYRFDRMVRPFVDAELTDRTYNNRVGYGPDVAINQLLSDIYDVSEGFTRDCWIIFRDIKAYFPSADLQRSYDHYRELIERSFPDGRDKDDLLYILLRTTWSYPAKNAVLKSPIWMWPAYIPRYKSVIFSGNPAKGAALGNQHWQVAQNYDLNDFDHRQIDHFGVHYGRFVDDMWWVFADKQAGLAHVALAERELVEYGYTMHPDKRYCQHYTKGGKFISTPFKMDRVYINNGVVNRARLKIRFWNRHAAIKNIDSFLSSVNSYLGSMKRLNAYAIIRNLIEEISPRWWRYCFYNDSRKCIQANLEYRHNILLAKKYQFKYKDKNEQGLSYYRYGFTPLPKSWAA